MTLLSTYRLIQWCMYITAVNACKQSTVGELTTHIHVYYLNIYPNFSDTPRIYNLSKATRTQSHQITMFI